MLALSTAALLSGCKDEGAAVLVRWRFIDGIAGTMTARCNNNQALDPDHYQCANVGGTDLVIDRIRLRTEIVGSDGTLSDQACATCCFHPLQTEWTTAFELPPHTYKLTLEAYACGQRVGSTPAPLVRTLEAGDIANMQAQAIELLPDDSFDAATRTQRCAMGRTPPRCWPAPPPECTVGGVADGGAAADAGWVESCR